MNIAEVSSKAYSLAYEYEQKYGVCPQCVLAALNETIGCMPPEVFKASQGLAGGTGLCGAGTCGALTGGILAIGVRVGRDMDGFKKGLPRQAFWLSKKLVEKFTDEFGGLSCFATQESRFGRSFDMWNPDDFKAFMEMGGHDDKCPYVAGKVAEWTVEILLEEEQKA